MKKREPVRVRKQMHLTESLNVRLRRVADEFDETESEIMRRALDRYLGRLERQMEREAGA